MKQALATAQAPAAIGPYSQGIAAGQTVYVSGQLPIDPATGAIPEGIAAQTAQSLKNLQAILAEQGMTLVMVTHEMNFARKVSDQVVFMHQGKVHEMGPPEELFGNPRTPELRQFLGMNTH